jgi:transcriptional regulator with XRE-family HTH domain
MTETVNIMTMTKLSNAALGTEINALIARRIAQLRKTQNLSFDALAARSDISKGMLVAIEQGTANPSIGTLCKLAATLRVSLTDLLGEEEQTSSAVQVVTPDQANDLWRGPKGGLATLLVGRAGPEMLELWEWTLFPGEEFQSKGHPKDTVELLSVTEGTLALEIDGVDHLIAASHRAVAITDRPHGYRCHGKKRTRFAMVVHEPGQSESP